jgi:hypothetical protein
LGFVILKIERHHSIDIAIIPNRTNYIQNSNLRLEAGVLESHTWNMTVTMASDNNKTRRLDFDLRRYETYVRNESIETDGSSGHYIFKSKYNDSEPLSHRIESF